MKGFHLVLGNLLKYIYNWKKERIIFYKNRTKHLQINSNK
jgi:hypothetical protein